MRVAMAVISTTVGVRYVTIIGKGTEMRKPIVWGGLESKAVEKHQTFMQNLRWYGEHDITRRRN